MTPISKLADGIFAAVAGYVARRLEPLAAELAELKNREPPKDGKKVDPDEVKAMVSDLVSTAVKEIELPAPRAPRDFDPQEMLKAVDEAVGKIEKPKDGKSVDQAAVIDELRKAIDQLLPQLVAERVKSVVEDLPKPNDGKSIDPATVQEMVSKAVELVRPKDGINGDPGRDALQIEPLPTVDVERAYPRGTWAMHAGGMVSSFRATTPGDVCEKNGWQVALNGIAEVAVDLAEDGRTVGVAMSMTDGTVLVKKLHFPVVLDKGTFNYEKEYARGDNVTWAGSCWIAQKDGLIGIEPRGAETGWRLSTKRGQNGKDGAVVHTAPPATVKL